LQGRSSPSFSLSFLTKIRLDSIAENSGKALLASPRRNRQQAAPVLRFKLNGGSHGNILPQGCMCVRKVISHQFSVVSKNPDR
jgi:hypothetical protein